jgi:uncharacterized Zn-finger protein
MLQKEIVTTTENRVACDGGDGPLGHPRVYLSLDDRLAIDCPYCGRRFERVASGTIAAH